MRRLTCQKKGPSWLHRPSRSCGTVKTRVERREEEREASEKQQGKGTRKQSGSRQLQASIRTAKKNRRKDGPLARAHIQNQQMLRVRPIGDRTKKLIISQRTGGTQLPTIGVSNTIGSSVVHTVKKAKKRQRNRGSRARALKGHRPPSS